MTVERALDIVDRLQGGFKPSVGSALSGDVSVNDLYRARRALEDFVWLRPDQSWQGSLAADMGDAHLGIRELDERIPQIDTRRGPRTVPDDRYARRPSSPPPRPRGAPAPTPSSGAYDDFMRRVNPSYRGSRAFHGTIPQATEAAMRHPVLGKGMSRAARQAARVGAAKALGAAAPFVDYALDPESRTPTQFLRSQEEDITGMVPGLVSPSELPPPAVLPPDRLEAVEATHGMTGIAPDPETPNVTVQEVRAYVKNRVAKGKKLPKWAESITSMKNGRLVIKPLNPRSKARQEAAKRPHNPRAGGPKRKHGTY